MSTPFALLAGSPDFLDPDVRSVASSLGVEAAWRKLIGRHGADAATRVSGSFSVALTDDTGQTFLAVDRFASFPLCWSLSEGAIRFASRADQLGDSNTIDPQAIFDYLYFHIIPSPRTVFRGVYRLPAAHSLWSNGGKVEVSRYWEPRFEEPRRANLDDLKAQFLSLVESSVASCAGEGRPVACFLSGGTDSSTVAGMIGQVTGQPASSYSIGFEAEGYDEMEYARIAARHFGTIHHEYYVTPGDLVQGIPTVAAHYDQPFGNSSALPAYYCARLAKSDGAGRILAGDGGDELFGGNTRYATQRVFEAWHSLPAALRSGVLEPFLADSGLFDRLPLARKGASYVRQARVPMPDRMQTYNLLGRLGIREVLSEGFLSTVDTGEPMRHQRETYAACNAQALVNRMLAYDWRYTLAENDLPKVVGATSLAGLPVAFPLLDSRLLDFSLSLPASYKVRGVKLRWFFKEALRGFLPDAIITKKKHGFGLPFGIWASRNPALRELAEESMQGLVERGLLNSHFVKRVFAEYLNAHPSYYGEIVWVSMMLEQWLRAKAPGCSFDVPPSSIRRE